MNKYYYHGIKQYYGCFGKSLKIIYNILKEGIKVRNEMKKYFSLIIEYILNKTMILFYSEIPNFADILDQTLGNKNNKK